MPTQNRRRLAGILLLSGAGVLAAGLSSAGEQLFSMVQTSSAVSDLRVELNGSAAAPSSVGEMVTGMQMSEVLATKDGTDLLLFGKSLSGDQTPYFQRIGLESTSGHYAKIMRDRVHLGTSAVPPHAAWVGSTQRHVALVQQSATVTFHEPIERRTPGNLLQTVVPDGWTVDHVNLPGGIVGNFIVATSPTRLFVSDLSTPQLVRIDAGAGPVTCSIQTGASNAVVSLAVVPGGGVAAGLSDGSLALVPETCSGDVPLAMTGSDLGTVYIYGGLSARSGRLFGSGYSSDGTQAIVRTWALSAGPMLAPMGAADFDTLNFAGSVATLQTGNKLLVGGTQGPLLGYQFRTYSGSFSPGADRAGTARVVTTSPTPLFSLSKRYFSLDAVSRVDFAELIVNGGGPATLNLYRGTCNVIGDPAITSVVQARRVPGKGIVVDVNPVVFPMPAAGMPDPPAVLHYNVGAGETALIAVEQAGRIGQDCTMTLTSTAPGGGGGALIRVSGTIPAERAMALVFDKSGSMLWGLNGGAASPTNPQRYDSLKTAAGAFANVVSILPDAQSIHFGAVSFEESVGAVTPINGNTLATDLPTYLNNNPPGGWTNARGGLKVAADWLNSLGGGVTERSVLLFTDGEHNRAGMTQVESPPFGPDPVDCLERPAPSTGCPNAPSATSDFLKAAPQNVNRLYALALITGTAYTSLQRLVARVNTTGSGSDPPAPAGSYLRYPYDPDPMKTLAQLNTFFHKVLWNYVGATELVDPIISVDNQRGGDAGGFGSWQSPPLEVAQGDVDLVFSVVWNGQLGMSLAAKDADTGAYFFKELTCKRGSQFEACRLPYNLFMTRPKRVIVEASPSFETRGVATGIIEIAGRGSVRLRTAFGRPASDTSQNLVARVLLTELGLPLRGATVRGTLTRPAAGLGTILGNTRISAADIDNYLKNNQDVNARADAKLGLLPGEMMPRLVSQPVTFRDDGQSGDGAANDGVYGALIDTPVPGNYTLDIAADYKTELSGTGSRQGSMSTQVLVGLDGDKSVIDRVRYTPPSGTTPGTLVLVLKPQDSKGNLLGPGNCEDLVFTQGDRTLPTMLTESAELDGTCTAEIGGIGPRGPVTLVAPGGSYNVISYPLGNPDGGPGPGGKCDGGCCCDLNPRASLPLPALLLFLLGAFLLYRRRRAR